jgi:hypothetical protein
VQGQWAGERWAQDEWQGQDEKQGQDHFSPWMRPKILPESQFPPPTAREQEHDTVIATILRIPIKEPAKWRREVHR